MATTYGPRARRCAFPSALAAAAVVAALLLELLLGRASPIGDASALVMPMQMLIGDFARAGELLLWNPWINGGAPDGVEPQFGAFSPLVVACAWIGGGTTLSFTLVFALTWCLGAAGFARLARHLGAPPWAQWALAVAFATDGAFVGHASHANVLHGIAFLPWALLGLDRALVGERGGRRWLDAAFGGAALGLGGLAGYPGVTVVHALFLACWAAWRAASLRARPLHALAALALTGVVAGVVLAPNHLGFLLEARGYTQREAALPRDVATGWHAEDRRHANALEPRALLTALHPGIVPRALEPRQEVLAYTDATSAPLHTGLGALVLAVLALAAPRARSARALAVVGVVFLLVAMGSVLPLRAWLYDLVPPTRFFRHASLFRVPWMVVIAVLAAMGARRLVEDERARRSFARLAPLVAVIAAAVSAAAHVALDLPFARDVVLWWIVAHGGLVLVALGLRGRSWRASLALWIAVEALAGFRVALPLVQGGPEVVRGLDARHVASIELGDAGFRRELLPRDADPELARALVEADARWLNDAADAGRIQPFDAHDVVEKRAVLLGRTAMDHALHVQIPLFPPLRDQALGAARVFFARDAIAVADGQDGFVEYASYAQHAAPALVIDGTEPDALEGEALLAKAAASQLVPQGARIERYRPTELVLVLDPPPAHDGWLYVTERWSPGWRATVDGAPVAIARAGYLWRAVPVAAGAERVAFAYRPAGFPWLLVASWGTLALVLGAGAVSTARARRAARVAHA